MINLRQAVRRSLREDSALTSVVGMDGDGEPKIYTFPIKPNVQKPYITVHQITVPGVDGVYGDDEVMERFVIQLSVWGESEDDAWAVAQVANDAMRGIRVQVEPYEHNFTQRYQNVESMPDQESSLWQVVMRYELRVGR